MRTVGAWLAFVVASWATLPTGLPVARAQADAPAALAAAHNALGGRERLAAVRTFVVTGRTRQVRADNLVGIEFQTYWQAPDRYVRRDEYPAQDRGPATSGFNGETLIEAPSPAPPPGPGRSNGPASSSAGDADGARLRRVGMLKDDFARVTLGMFAGVVSVVPLTFTPIGVAEAPQGQADVFEAKGPGSFSARFFVDRTTSLPVMVSWLTASAAPVPGGLMPRGRASDALGASSGPAPPLGPRPPGIAKPEPSPSSTPTEARLYFADYRDVDGLKWPFRIRRALGADPVEETIVDRFRVNVTVDPRRFEVAR